MPQLIAEAQLKITTKSETGGISDAQNKVEGFRGSLSRIGEIAAGIGLAKLANDFINLGRSASSFAINTASDFQQWKIAFDTMLGDAGKASKLMNEISNFAMKTPFELPELVDGAKRLLAYNIEAQNIVPTMEMLGNITAGVGKDKLPQLILAFGQVKAATKLTGAELRQFSEAGVPLLEALVNKANETGGALVAMGGASSDTTKKAAKLSSTLADQAFKLSYLKETGKEGTSAFKSLQESISFNEAKLKTFGPAAETVYKKVQATAADMIEQVRDGKVSFDEVNDALKKMTSEGGKFFGLMEKQSKTFGGILSNIKDNFTRLALEIMGFDMIEGSETFGQLKEGTLFDKLTKGAEKLFTWLNENKAEIVKFATALLFIGVFVVEGIVIPAIEFLGDTFLAVADTIDFFKQNGDLAVSMLMGVAGAIGAYVIPLFITWAFTTLPAAILAFSTLMLTMLPFIALGAIIALVVYGLHKAWEVNFFGIRDITKDVMTFIVDIINGAIDVINDLIDGLNSLTGKITGVQGQMGKISHRELNMGGGGQSFDSGFAFASSAVTGQQTPIGPAIPPGLQAANRTTTITQYNTINNVADWESLLKQQNFMLNK